MSASFICSPTCSAAVCGSDCAESGLRGVYSRRLFCIRFLSLRIFAMKDHMDAMHSMRFIVFSSLDPDTCINLELSSIADLSDSPSTETARSSSDAFILSDSSALDISSIALRVFLGSRPGDPSRLNKPMGDVYDCHWHIVFSHDVSIVGSPVWLMFKLRQEWEPTPST